jgi:HTH-like domain
MRARGFRVKSVCRVLTEHGVQVAPHTYRNWKTADQSARTVTDAALTDTLRTTVGTPEGMYGRRKMTAYLRRQGHQVTGCTVDRLMRDEGLSGVVRGRRHRTTIPGKDHQISLIATSPTRRLGPTPTPTRGRSRGSSTWPSSWTAIRGPSSAYMRPP